MRRHSFTRHANKGVEKARVAFVLALLVGGPFVRAGSGPVITGQPTNAVVWAGDHAIFAIQASGDPPPVYQWEFNGSAIAGATSDTLILSMLQPAQAGDYVAIASNIWGSASSAPANLRVEPALDTSPLDLSFDPGEGADDFVFSVATQPDGKVVIAGEFRHFDGIERPGVARLNSDGSLDLDFNPPLLPGPYYWNCVRLQDDGKLVFGGGPNGNLVQPGMMRLNADGSLDTSFSPRFDIAVQSVALQPDGKIVALGNTNVNGWTGCVARLNSDGSFDATFQPGSGPNGGFAHGPVAVAADGHIAIGGGFSAVNGVPRSGLALLDWDGSVDLTFDAHLDSDAEVFAIAPQPDGELLVGGSGLQRPNFARFHRDGRLDASFGSSEGADGSVNAILIRPDGKIFIGGNFARVNGLTARRIALLNSDGSPAPEFNIGPGADQPVYALALQGDGRLMVAGAFGAVEGKPRRGIARLQPRAGEPVPLAVIAAPVAQTVSAGDALLLQAGVSGSQPPVYQWQLNGIPIPGATNATLQIANAQLSQTGEYILAASNSQLTRKSAPVHVTVRPTWTGLAWENGVFSIHLPTAPDKKYLLEFKDSIGAASWTALPALDGNGAIRTLTDPSATAGARFYRVRVDSSLF